ncbi:hypothetical protein J6590_079249 [Homalodisca vitripennis]|nr:hypothetical protein J6590_079249 [Homalodisca vitripennis]
MWGFRCPPSATSETPTAAVFLYNSSETTSLSPPLVLLAPLEIILYLHPLRGPLRLTLLLLCVSGDLCVMTNSTCASPSLYAAPAATVSASPVLACPALAHPLPEPSLSPSSSFGSSPIFMRPL